MLRCSKFLTLLLLLSPAIGFARGVPNGESPAFATVPELSAGFDLLYEQKDKKLGMEQVARAAENGRYLRPFAKIILALAACRENQVALARKLLRELIEQYPDSELFASEYAKVSSLPVPAAPVH